MQKPTKRTLLHTCCGPCASACTPRLKELGRGVTLFFANSNIDTREEYEKRLAEARKLAAADGVGVVALPYDHAEWLREVAAGYEGEPEKGARCTRCFRYNLKKAAEYAAANGFDEFTTSLTVSPHKVSKTIFEVGRTLAHVDADAEFLPIDFKKREGFKLSVRRAAELGLYRQSYCGCEFSKWRLHHKTETASTNADARSGRHGDVFTADFQTAGRGRLDHKWLSPPGTNLLMSVVLSVGGLSPEHIATLPLVVGLAVVRALSTLDLRPATLGLRLKWPNDVLVDGKKVAGILCERVDDRVIAGIGVNVETQQFPPEVADRAIALESLLDPQSSTLCSQSSTSNHQSLSIPIVRDVLLRTLGVLYEKWRADGFAAIYPEISGVDCLRGQTLSVLQTDDDAEPVRGICGGILPDGSLDVGGTRVYAGEAHIVSCRIPHVNGEMGELFLYGKEST